MSNARLSDMESLETRGQLLRRRMDELGMNQTQLVEASGLSAKTVSRALNDWPQTRESTYANLFRVLDDIEADREPGPAEYFPSPDGEPFKIQMQGVYGIKEVTFSGPASDPAAVRQAAVDFVREVQSGGPRPAGETSDNQD